MKAAEDLFSEICSSFDEERWTDYDEAEIRLKKLLEDRFQAFPFQRLWIMITEIKIRHHTGNEIVNRPVQFCIMALSLEMQNEISSMYLESETVMLETM